MLKETTPFDCHIFICTNDRHGARKSCADNESVEIRQQLKDLVVGRNLKPRVRVSQSGCLGLCAKGPNVILYPQRILYSGVVPSDVPSIIEDVEALIDG